MLIDLTIRNYKSLRDVRLQNLPGFCALVGANASGKSNFADALDFLAIALRDGLAAAVRAKGGYENICFRRFRRSKASVEFALKIASDVSFPPAENKRRFQMEIAFGFRAASEAIASEYFVTHETLRVVSVPKGERLLTLTRKVGEATDLSLTKTGDRLLRLPPKQMLTDWLDRPEGSADELALTRLGYFGAVYALLETIRGCRVPNIPAHGSGSWRAGTLPRVGTPRRKPARGNPVPQGRLRR